MPVIPFSHSWPYEKQYQDIYLHECPFCGEDQVLTHMKMKELEEAKEGIKNAFSFSIYTGAVVMLLGFCVLPFIKYIFGVNDSVNGYLNDYLLVYFAGYLFFSLNNFLISSHK